MDTPALATTELLDLAKGYANGEDLEQRVKACIAAGADLQAIVRRGSLPEPLPIYLARTSQFRFALILLEAGAVFPDIRTRSVNIHPADYFLPSKSKGRHLQVDDAEAARACFVLCLNRGDFNEGVLHLLGNSTRADICQEWIKDAAVKGAQGAYESIDNPPEKCRTRTL